MDKDKNILDIELVTPRLVIRRVKNSDRDSIYRLAKDPRVGPRAGWKPHASPQETEEVIEKIFLINDTFLISSKESGEVLGIIAIENDRYRPDANSGELGYWLGHDYWGHGIMTEAAGAAIKYAFEEKGLDMLGICTAPVNRRSQRVIQKCGFTYEGTIRRTFKIYNGTLRDSRIYSMTSEEYKKSLEDHAFLYEGVKFLKL